MSYLEDSEMYGTVARIKLHPGNEQEFLALQEEYRHLQIDGFVAEALYRADSGGDEYWLAVVFESREKYHANAASPEQDARYQKMAALLVGEPEWHDGEVLARHVFNE